MENTRRSVAAPSPAAKGDPFSAYGSGSLAIKGAHTEAAPNGSAPVHAPIFPLHRLPAAVLRKLSAAYGYLGAQAIGPSSIIEMRRALSGLVSTTKMSNCVLTSARERPPRNNPHAQRPTHQAKRIALRRAPPEIGPKRLERRLDFLLTYSPG